VKEIGNEIVGEDVEQILPIGITSQITRRCNGDRNGATGSPIVA
jgi:hypothetical protein